MSCFKDLVKLNFLANASKELKQAQKIEYAYNQFPNGSIGYTHVFTKSIKAAHYKYVFDLMNFKNELLMAIDDDPKVINSIESENIFFVFSKTKKLVDKAVKACFCVHGFLPLCTKKHVFAGKSMYTALIDMRIVVPPGTTN